MVSPPRSYQRVSEEEVTEAMSLDVVQSVKRPQDAEWALAIAQLNVGAVLEHEALSFSSKRRKKSRKDMTMH